MATMKQIESRIEAAKAALAKQRESGAVSPVLRAARKRVKRLQRKRRVLATAVVRATGGGKKKPAAESPTG